MKADGKYISYLDGLRGYSILLVLIGHFFPPAIHMGRFGVTVFFFVSGFLITKLLIYEFDKKGTINLKDFYLRRLFRLYPALLFMLLISICVLYIHNFQIIKTDIAAGIFYFTNYYLVYFLPEIPHNYLLVSNILWSLSVEEHFYLIFPVAFVLFYPAGKKFLNVMVFILFLFLAIRIINAIVWPDRFTTINYYTTHSRGDSILYGCVSALLLYRLESRWYIAILKHKLIFYVGLALIVFSLVYRELYFQGIAAYTIQGLALFFLVPCFYYSQSNGVIKTLIDNKATVYIGKLSYSLYLFHWVSLKIGNLYFPDRGLEWYALVVPLTIILSLISYYFIEQPFVSLRKKFGSHVKISVVS